MNFFTKCDNCKKRKWYVAKRTIIIPKVGKITSTNKLCGPCYKSIKKVK